MTRDADARALSAVDDVHQLLAMAARDAHAFGNVFDASSTTDDDATRRRRELYAHIVRAIADGVADALDACNEMADQLTKPRQDG